MAFTKDEAKQKISELVAGFERNKHFYLSKDYVEAQARIDFVTPLFEALGWDMKNVAGLAPFEREVLVEKDPETTGRPDYSFRVGGATKFFVEAKAPSATLSKPNDIIQAKTYAWNTKNVFVVVLTDFEELKIYDASLKPSARNPEAGLVHHLKYTEYVDKLDTLLLLSKDAVEAGSLDTILRRDVASKRMRIPVDEAFLVDMTRWREELAKDLFKRNEDISVRMLNDVVQKILDRLVFIRIMEDRKIIDPKTLLELVDQWKAEGKRKPLQSYLNPLFKQVNADFNGEIFKPHACEQYEFDSNLLSSIIENLYFPECPYQFDVIGVELLGSIYERYLGKTIRFTDKRVKVEDKPEVRKAGGVYYTPKFVVDAIVENTVGRLIEGKTPDEIAKLKILDMACGSGSFLLGAFQKLIDYHTKYYAEHPKEAKVGKLFPHLIVERDGTHRLSVVKKSEILKNNLYGVDLDPQAVEITMLSLYIKTLEGERVLGVHNKELLPTLKDSIKCGNSLISYDFFEQKTLVEEKEKERVNPFEWKSKTTGFSGIIEEGGFDVIIGNPPYVRIQTMREWAPKEVDYFSKRYKTAASGNYDLYVVFVEKAMELLNDKGLFGFICPHKFFQANYGENLRKIIAEKKLLREIVNFTDQQVFKYQNPKGPTIYTCLLFLDKAKKKEFKYSEIRKLENPAVQLAVIQKNDEYSNGTLRVDLLPITSISEQSWQFGFGGEAVLMEKLNKVKTKLGDVASTIFVGLQTSADPIYIVERKNPAGEGKLVEVYSKALNKNLKIEADILKPLLKGQEIKRYSTPIWRYYIIFPYNIVNGEAALISKEEIEQKYPRTWQYLNTNRKRLQVRDRGKLKVEWYAFGRTQNIEQFYEPKIMTQVLASNASFTLDKEGLYYFVGGGNAGGYGIKVRLEYNVDLRYLTGLLNSKLLDFYLKKVSTRFRGGFFSYAKRFIEQLPIYIPKSTKEKEKYKEIVSLVDKVLDLNKKKQVTPESSKKEMLEREAKVYEEKIDELVYELYGITEAEQKIIEESIAR